MLRLYIQHTKMKLRSLLNIYHNELHANKINKHAGYDGVSLNEIPCQVGGGSHNRTH